MKTIAALLLVAITPGVSEPEYGCNLEKGYCVVNIQTMQELMKQQKPRCNFYGA